MAGDIEGFEGEPIGRIARRRSSSNHLGGPAQLRKTLKGMDCAGRPELDAVRDWLLAGLFLELNESSRGAAAIAAAARAFFRETGDIGLFVSEACETCIADGKACIFERTVTLYAAYSEWAERSGLIAQTITAFGPRLSELEFPVRRRGHDRRKCRFGIKLKLPLPPQRR